MNYKKEDVLHKVKAYFDGVSNQYLDSLDSQERDRINYWFEKKQWESMSDDEKQERRKGVLITGRKWSRDPFVPISKAMLEKQIESSKPRYQYAQRVIQIYDMIRELISKIDKSITPDDLLLMRFLAFLYLEKENIDKNISMFKSIHVPSEIFSNLSNQLKSKYSDWELDSFQKKYSQMYDIWRTHIIK